MEPPAASSCSTFYALSFQLAFRYLQAEGFSLQFISVNSWQIGSVVFKRLESNPGFYHRQVGLNGFQLLLNYRSNTSLKEIAEQVTFTDILTNQVNPNFIKNKIILIGVTDLTIKDDFNTPYNREIRGLILHAQMVSQLISAVKDRRSLLWFLPLWVDVLWVWVWSLGGGLLTLYSLSSLLRLGLTSGVIIITLNGICWFFLLINGGLLPLIPSMLAVVAMGGTIVAYRAAQT